MLFMYAHYATSSFALPNCSLHKRSIDLTWPSPLAFALFRWSQCLSTWRNGSEGSEFASTSPFYPCSSTSSPRSQWVTPPAVPSAVLCPVCTGSYFPPIPLSLGGHVFWRHFHQPGPWFEHLPGCYCTAGHYGFVYRHRCVCNHAPRRSASIN